MKRSENQNIICSCVGNHTCGILANPASNDPPQQQDTVENVSLDTDSNSSAATNPGNETIRAGPPTNEDSGIDTLLTGDVPSVLSAFSSANTSPDTDAHSVPPGGANASLGHDATPDTEPSLSLDTSSGIVSINSSSIVSEDKSASIKIVIDNVDDKSTRSSPSQELPPSADPQPNLSSNPGTPTHKAGGTVTITPEDSGVTSNPSRPSGFSSGLRRNYHEFSKTATEDGILKSIPYDSSEDMASKKKKTGEETYLKVKSSSSSSGSRSRTSSASRSVESRDTSIENLSGYSTDPQDDNDWYLRMRTRGPKISVTGSVRPDGTIDETEEHRSTAEGSFLSANPPPEGDICENIYFGRKSPSIGEDGLHPKQDENPQQEDNDGDSEENKEDNKEENA